MFEGDIEEACMRLGDTDLTGDDDGIEVAPEVEADHLVSDDFSDAVGDEGKGRHR